MSAWKCASSRMFRLWYTDLHRRASQKDLVCLGPMPSAYRLYAHAHVRLGCLHGFVPESSCVRTRPRHRKGERQVYRRSIKCRRTHEDRSGQSPELLAHLMIIICYNLARQIVRLLSPSNTMELNLFFFSLIGNSGFRQYRHSNGVCNRCSKFTL